MAVGETEATNTTIDAMPCVDMVKKYVTDEYTQLQMIEEFALKQEIFLCPDAASWELFYPSWLSWGNEKAYSFFQIEIKPVDGLDDAI